MAAGSELPRLTRRMLLRVGAAAVVLAATTTTPLPLVPLGPQQVVATCDPKVGVHTRLTDEVEEWKIKRTLSLVRQMGAGWVAEYFPWAYMEPTEGRYDWAHADLVIHHAARQGLTVIARLGMPPEWARPKDSASSLLLEASYPTYAAFCATFARRYRGLVQHLIPWNEPNLALEWGFRSPDPEGHAELQRLCYRAVKEAEPSVTVLGGALAPVSSSADPATALDDLTYLERLALAGALQHMDGLAVHAYGWASPPDEAPNPEVVNFRRTELVHEALGRLGAPDLPIFVTEGGWNDHPRWTRAVSPPRRVEYTVDAYRLAAESWPWCRCACMWAFRFPRPERSYQDGFAFVSPGFDRWPVYDAVQRYTHGCL